MKVKEFIPASSVPKITKFWNFEKNKGIDINMTSALAQKPLLSWKCKRCGYEWKASVYNRYVSKGECPRCEQKKVIWSGHNDAVTLVPGIMDEWDKEKNDVEDIHLENEGVGSKKMAYWKCPVCHREFRMAIGNRIRKQKDGTYLFVSCTHKRQDIPMISEVEKLVDFWDFDENKGIDINTTSVMMKRPSVHWKCKRCHFKWTAPVYSRYKAKAECPCCDQGHGVSPGYNDISTILPDALNEWDFDANASEGIDIKKIGVGSKTVVNWKCPVCGRKFRKAMSRRVDKKKDGTYRFMPCQHKDTSKIKPEDKEKVSEVPKLMKFWDKEHNTMDPAKTPSNSSKRVYWKCPDCGYEWETSVAVRLDASDRCPHCGEKRDYSVKKGVNDIFTIFPQAKKYYDFDKNTGLDPYSVSYNSKIPLFDWKCPHCGYAWQSTFFGMTGGKTKKSFAGCPNCGINKGSTVKQKKNNSIASVYDIPDLLRFWDFEKNAGIDPRVIQAGSRETFFWKCPVCGREWEATAKSRLISRNCPCCEVGNVIVKGVNDVLTVKPEFSSLFDFDNNPDIDIYSEGVHSAKIVNYKCKKCGNRWRGTIASRFRYGKDKNDLIFIDCQKCSSGHSRDIPYAEEYPQLVDMCDEQASGRTIFSIRTYDDSYIPMTWICPTCKKRYKTSTARIIIALKKGRTGCPYCALIRVKPGESFADVYPQYLSMWYPDNDKEPDKISYNAASRFYWICPDCGGKYSSTIQDIVSGKAECPYCNDRQVLPGFNSFKIKHPDLMDEWLYLNNSLLADPDQISENYNKKVWWECSQGHHYPMSPAKRIMFQKRHREPCPFCKGRRLKLRHYY